VKFNDREFIGVMLGADIGAYSMARAFYQEYKIKSVVIGQSHGLGPAQNSKIIENVIISDPDSPKVFIDTVNGIAERYKEKKLILFACSDLYVKLVVNTSDNLAENVIAPFVDKDTADTLMSKEKFYEICKKHGLDYPKTFIYTKDTPRDFKLPFDFPIILKPSDGRDYRSREFEGQLKAFTLDTREQLDTMLARTYESGYSSSMIIQEFIPGDDTAMRVLTCYSDKNHNVTMMALGRVILEEHTPFGIGNYVTVINDADPELFATVKEFLEKIEFVGFSNFDMKFDKRDDKYKMFEINLRQGRSNYFVTASGTNICKFPVEDLILDKTLETEYLSDPHFTNFVPNFLALSYVDNPALKKLIKQLIRHKRWRNPIWYKRDLGLKRLIYYYASQISYVRKFKKKSV